MKDIVYEQTEDENFINHCLTHPAAWRMGSDDSLSGANPRLFFAQIDGILYIKAGEYGLLILKPMNYISFDVHVALLPEARGKAVDICNGAMQWVFEHSARSLRLTASIPEYNKLAIRLAYKIGMEFIGINKLSFQKDGKLFDQHLFGISKGDICQEQH